ncbi:MAG: hypothetical protein GXY49_13995 [Syntrophomonadaceae bacterium]|nr:hypothetical protein [Syntrophomonadaceae bacterium]
MRVLICIDDTDNIDIKRGTGQLASLLAEEIEQKGWAKCEAVTRHQLLVHPDVPYTSHNSAMCFAADIQPQYLEDIIRYGGDFLERERAVGSDPGLCIVIPDRLTNPGWLIAYGFSAKQEVLNKEYAYSVAAELGVHLSEHGGTGDGVVGALAGTGLRLSGNDGRFRGKFTIGIPGESLTVAEIYAKTYITRVRNKADGRFLLPDERIELGEVVKAVLIDREAVLLVNPLAVPGDRGAVWRTCSKEELKGY